MIELTFRNAEESHTGRIIDYLAEKYEPHAIILYGSYADGSNNANSDFDALIITDQKCAAHDGSIVDNVPLDVFIYHTAKFDGEIDYRNFIQVHDGNIVLDNHGAGLKLKSKVLEYIENMPQKSYDEKLHQVEWCEKMLLRAARSDTEGYYRWHWLLTDSLEIYFDICGQHFFGPKKALAKMKAQDPKAFAYYSEALLTFEYEAARKWVEYLHFKLDNSINR